MDTAYTDRYNRQAAILLMLCKRTPMLVASKVVVEGRVNWDEVDRAYPSLSGGEKRIVQFAKGDMCLADLDLDVDTFAELLSVLG